ncbi:putative pentatricopeptide repeat-containing protein At5g37570 [Nymphaea colorata]|nr:putative pentatricopeptide repeat-containing protein At5g37570 [Nymphaea colorata]XP_049936018.1 putative pentatricopeptide repeat-containing protein At5g37570 [Nymphaea colorata]XP_049936019.1 putative pentatricopeptide repeat-containing protein At5g37570 [Nymphaea colorata]XP_049936020.1 putative pentatricopeptide repeat-containing protein At5g37570 [Nymphaea colorata]XP_049936021.1 putative pentatricopeptide repeat-containing protein At5g37570 [Nymphaea colorata]XP_049936022.1 putative p
MSMLLQSSKFEDSAIDFAIKVAKNIQHLKQVHAHMTKVGVDQQESLVARLLHFLPHLNYARQLFDEMQTTDQFLWTAMIRAYTQKTLYAEAFLLFRSMHRSNVPPNQFTFSSAIHSCAHLHSVREGREAHSLVIKWCSSPGAFVETALLNMYSRFCVVDDARRLFDEMSQRDVVSWTAMVDGYARVGLMDHAHKLFDEMPEKNVVSWTAMVGGYADAGKVDLARQLFDKMPERNAVSWTKMITGYGKCGDVRLARELFDRVPLHDVATWSAMISCYTQNGLAKEAMELFEMMKRSSIKPNEITMVSVISAAAQLGDAKLANRILDYIESWRLETTVFMANALIHMHAKCGDMENAHKVFNRMTDRDVITYTAMINALADHGRGQDALDIFSKMQRRGIKPNAVTFIGVLNACSHAGLVDEGRKYFEYMKSECQITPMTEHYACIVDLFSRAGLLDEAYQVILGMTAKPDAAVWGALLSACRVYSNTQLAEIAAKRLFELEPENTGNYVLLSSIYASTDKWGEAAKLRKEMEEKLMRKSPGCSWVSR